MVDIPSDKEYINTVTFTLARNIIMTIYIALRLNIKTGTVFPDYSLRASQKANLHQQISNREVRSPVLAQSFPFVGIGKATIKVVESFDEIPVTLD